MCSRSLLEPHGEVRVVKYRADHDGFQSEVTRHGGRLGHGDSTHGGGLGATIGGGPSHDLGSHGLGVSAVHAVQHVQHVVKAKEAIPIHEETHEGAPFSSLSHASAEESSSQWSAIEDPTRKRHAPADDQVRGILRLIIGDPYRN